ncbi:hypothetical protein [Kiloniella sp. EL199]|uniref:hypothetical protein n=1 Tax=Kiloniella sp. EL199 TaxID=2107581 RepID=UPI000EA27BB5|nr:hypothetical protein [Kiloniella sp. EL199]
MLQNKIEFSGYKKVFCESLRALEKAYEMGLSKDAKILCRSPAILDNKKINSINLDERVNIKELQSLFDRIDLTCKKCFDVFQDNEELHEYAHLLTQMVWLWNTKIIQSGFLISDDFKEPCLILNPNSGNAALDQNWTLPWTELLKDNTNAVTHAISIDLNFTLRTEKSTLGNNYRKLRLMGWRHVLWRLGCKLWSKLPHSLSRGTVYYFRENELLRDVASEFILKGYSASKINTKPLKTLSENTKRIADTAIQTSQDILLNHIKKINTESSHHYLFNELRKLFQQEIETYRINLEYLSIDKNFPIKTQKDVVLTNYPWAGFCAALARVCDAKRVPFVGFQHGVTREIISSHQNKINYENVSAPYAAFITQQGKAISDHCVYRQHKSREHTVALGAVSDFINYTKRSTWKTKSNRIIYPASLNQPGYFFNGGVYQNDYKNYQSELKLVNEVFSAIPHSVDYKPYPTKRYPDESPLIRKVMETKNMTLLTSEHDFRFIAQQYGLIITCGASSTLSWCLMSGIPTLYIDSPYEGYRLSEDLKAFFKNQNLYFDLRNPDCYEDLAVQLKKPLTDFSSVWKRDTKRRETMLKQLFGLHSSKSGPNGYKWLKTKMNESF